MERGYPFEKIEDEFLKNPARFANYVYAITSELYKLGIEMTKESLEEMDWMIQENSVRMRFLRWAPM